MTDIQPTSLWTPPARSGLILPGSAADDSMVRRPSGLIVPGQRTLDVVRGPGLVVARPGVAPSDVIAESWQQTARTHGEDMARLVHGRQADIVARVDADIIRAAMVEALQQGRLADAVSLANHR